MIVLKIWKLCIVCIGAMLILGGCGTKSELKNELDSVTIDIDLPEPDIRSARRLEDVDDAVYEQQLAACELYIESYEMTKTSDYAEKYKDDVKKERVAYYCNERRKELQLDIATSLEDNIYSMVKSVEDCDNISAYIKRVNYDTVNFYDYYSEYINSNDETDALCKILKTFYEKTNVLAFRFMAEHEEEFIKAALERIEANARQNDSLNMYIAENNELTKALNEVYGGVPEDYAVPIREANIKLARKLLESDNELTEDDIDILMQQLGEPTPEPSESPTPEPTDTPSPTDTPRPTQTPRPTSTPRPTQAPIQRPQPTQRPEPEEERPVVTASPATEPPTDPPAATSAPEPTGQNSYYFELD